MLSETRRQLSKDLSLKGKGLIGYLFYTYDISVLICFRVCCRFRHPLQHTASLPKLALLSADGGSA